MALILDEARQGNFVLLCYRICSIVYAFKFRGFRFGILNIFVPFSATWDIITALTGH